MAMLVRTVSVFAPPSRDSGTNSLEISKGTSGWNMTVRILTRQPGIATKLAPVEIVRDLANLFPRGLSQRLIDPVLPARPRLLEVVKNVPINPQRNLLFGAGDRGCFRSRLGELCGRLLERRFGSVERAGCSARSV